MARVPVPNKMKEELLKLNAYSCCVCKKTGVGLNFHHIDGDNSNTVIENMAVLCVNEHDAHHRPKQYPKLNHLDLSSEKLLIYKKEWEEFVKECQKDTPNVLATINAFGTYENIVGMKIIFQYINGKIIFERCYQQLDGNLDYWTDEAINEVLRLGKNIKIALIDKPLPIEFCSADGHALSHIFDEPAAKQIAYDDWNSKSSAAVYINPYQPSLAISIFYEKELIYTVSIHRCKNRIRYIDYKGGKSTKVRVLQVRKQVEHYIRKVLKSWTPGIIFYGTGESENPTIIKKCKLPLYWEFKNCK